MTNNDKCCPPIKEVEDFLFKQASVNQICDEFQNIPINSSLIAVDGKRGLLYVGYENTIIVVKPGSDQNIKWKFELNLTDKVSRVGLSCDSSLLAVIFNRPVAIIYDASSIHKHKLDVLHEIRLSATGGSVSVLDFKWNPAIPEMLCSISSDHVIGCFQVSRDKKAGIQIVGMERPQGFEALCVSWSPKGKQLVIGCKNGDIIQLKPELKVARHIPAPNPSEGLIISILWVSNYQFCACFLHSEEQRISVTIVDCPKGATVARFTNYEDITFGSGPMDNLCYYFEHIAEWGIIIAASSHSSEVAVLGSIDNGATWNQYQLMDDSTAQLPLNRKKEIENYPVGLAVDKTSTQKLAWGSESTLPNPVPILRILVSSGQLCCYHMVHLKPNTPNICNTPTENVPDPPQPRPSLAPSEVSFNIHPGITSTPRSKEIITEKFTEKSKINTNIFGDNSNNSFSFLTSNNKSLSEVSGHSEIKTLGFSTATQNKGTTMFGQVDGKIGLFNQEIKTTKPGFIAEGDKPIRQPNLQQIVKTHPEIKSPEYTLKPDSRSELKPTIVQTIQPPITSGQEKTKEAAYQQSNDRIALVKEPPVYDDGICLRAYYEEQARFEKELKGRLDVPQWNCGTEEERKLLIKRSDEIAEFLRELFETTYSLGSDISYLQALLLQSFAWLEECKSKNSANVSVSSRSRSDGNKFADLQRLYYYTRSQLIQATKVLDLEWDEHNNRKISRMKIPCPELIYQSLINYTQIINHERKNVEALTKKWRTLSRGSSAIGPGSSGTDGGLGNLNRSLAGLDISQSGGLPANELAIDLRCKLIASSTRDLSREKQSRLRDLLSESAPRIIRAARPTAVQDRLEATLSSLASAKGSEAVAAAKAKPSRGEGASPRPAAKAAQTPLSTLASLVSGIGEAPGPNKSPSGPAAFPGQGSGIKSVAPAAAALASKPKEPTSLAQLHQSPPKGFGLTSLASVPKSTFSFSSTTTASAAATPTLAAMTSGVQGFASAPKLDSASMFNLSSKPSPSAAPVDLSSLNFTGRPGLTVTAVSPESKAAPALALPTPVLNFGKPAATAVASPGHSIPNQTQAVTDAEALFALALSGITSDDGDDGPAAPAPVFGSGSGFGGSNSFGLSGSSTQAPTTSSAMPFGTLATTAASLSQGFSSLARSTSSLTFGTTATASASTTAAPFGKSTASPGVNVFGGNGAAPLIQASTTTSSFFGKSGTMNPVSANPAATQAALVSSTAASCTTAVASTTSSSVFGSTPTVGSFGFGGQHQQQQQQQQQRQQQQQQQQQHVTVTCSSSIASTPATGNSFFSTSTLLASKTPVTTSAPTASIFGSAATSNSSIFGGGGATTTPTFAAPSPNTQANNIFGTNNTAANNGTSMFGGTSTSTSTPSVFGASSPITNSVFGQAAGSSVTSTASATLTPSTSVFGNSGPNIFGSNSTNASNTGSVFGSTTAPAASIFGAATSGTATSSVTSMFGAAATGAPTTSATSIFGGGSAGSTTTSSASMFGAPATTTPASGASIFGGTPASPGSSSFFGASGSSSMFGAAASPPSGMGTTSVFGQAATFATNPVFGSTPAEFGAAKPGFAAPGFGSPTTFGNAPAGGFGSPSILGSGSPLAGASPSNVFGSNTFEALSAQSGGLSFGSLAQKTPEPVKPQSFQGSSSFSSWR